MELNSLLERLKEANQSCSLRQIAKYCSVSHEAIRKLLASPEAANVTAATYTKIDKGLRDNGF